MITNIPTVPAYLLFSLSLPVTLLRICVSFCCFTGVLQQRYKTLRVLLSWKSPDSIQAATLFPVALGRYRLNQVLCHLLHNLTPYFCQKATNGGASGWSEDFCYSKAGVKVRFYYCLLGCVPVQIPQTVSQ